jgi:hypothetical protein
MDVQPKPLRIDEQCGLKCIKIRKRYLRKDMRSQGKGEPNTYRSCNDGEDIITDALLGHL